VSVGRADGIVVSAALPSATVSVIIVLDVGEELAAVWRADWMRGSSGSTPGSEPRTDCRKLGSWKNADMSLAARSSVRAATLPSDAASATEGGEKRG